MDQNIPPVFVLSLKQIRIQKINIPYKIFFNDYFVIRIAAIGIDPFNISNGYDAFFSFFLCHFLIFDSVIYCIVLIENK